MKKRIIALSCLVAVCLSISFAPAAHAVQLEKIDPGNSVNWVNTSTIALGLTFSSGTANCSGVVYGYANVKKIEASFQLLKKNSSGLFVPDYTWPKVTANSDYLTWSGTRSVDKGVYRLQVTAVVTNKNNVSETIVTYCEKEYK